MGWVIITLHACSHKLEIETGGWRELAKQIALARSTLIKRSSTMSMSYYNVMHFGPFDNAFLISQN